MSKLRASTQVDATGTPSATTFLRGDDTWAVPPVGGSSSAPVQHKRTAGNVTINWTAWAAIDTATDITLAAQVSDIIEIAIAGFYNAGSAVYVRNDVATVVSGALTNYVSSGSTAPTTWGVAAWLAQAGDAPVGGSVLYTVQSADLSAGDITLRVITELGSAGSRDLDAGTGDPFWFWARNLSR